MEICKLNATHLYFFFHILCKLGSYVPTRVLLISQCSVEERFPINITDFDKSATINCERR